MEDETPGFVGGLMSSATSIVARRPIDALAAALAVACTVMIFVNALVIQARPAADKSRAAQHVAQPAQAGVRTDAPKRSELVAQVQTALAERGLYEGAVDGLPGSATAGAIRAFEQSQGLGQTGEASEKILAALLIAPAKRSEATSPQNRAARQPQAAPAASAQASAAPLATGSTAAPNPNLMAAQRALAKIGYGPVTIDGRLGAETRNAIKSFERDRGMPETGELTPPVMRALQAMTGAPLQ